MDFIKTSSLRALIELTFQRNWNGLIWMSRKGVITKRVETVQTALSRNSAQTAQSGWPRNYCFRARPKSLRPTEVSAKVQTDRPITQRDPGNIVPRSAKPNAHATPRTTKAREPGNKASRPRNPFAYHGRCIRPSRERTSHVRPRFHRPNSSVRPRRPTASSGHDRSDSAHDPMSGRSSRPTVPTPRSTRSPF
ncbi:unnamed protein product [Microthlaspi erraticum]|uniref:Uncharacterized protein n=1 Tax=Microthlaspi erraticum TaxID=1685480 RepID=A0A6D2J5X5_9BRAS|nr:unnamed protein product [Microthlaspi erraticum]